jgi:uncharacterized protein YbcC (UPF0753/DUF2309 family)
MSADNKYEHILSLVAPVWPLDRSIAVNPYWGQIKNKFPEVLKRRYLLGGFKGYLSDLQNDKSLDKDSGLNNINVFKLYSDYFDEAESSSISWKNIITNQISFFCAAFFDKDQADWSINPYELYISWLEFIRADRNIPLLKDCRNFHLITQSLPNNYRDVLVHFSDNHLEAGLYSINGWASWCSYLKWNNPNNNSLIELLAVRMAWELILLDLFDKDELKHEFFNQQLCSSNFYNKQQQELESIEKRYYTKLIHSLKNNSSSDFNSEFEAIFCIDVRSENMRVSCEKFGIKTRGFAGFFGLPLEFKSKTSNFSWPLLPGLLSPSIQVQGEVKTLKYDNVFARMPISSFSYVETLGFRYLIDILKNAFYKNKADIISPTNLEFNISIEDKILIAHKVLNAMGLTRNFSKNTLLVGHTSITHNNPKKASLDCGACCGQSGEINVRVLSNILNDKDVRQGLTSLGININPEITFYPALHVTTKEELVLLESPLEFSEKLKSINSFAKVKKFSNVSNSDLQKIEKIVKRKSLDWSEVRPEWGLANNAAFIAAPRSRTINIDLEGRAFLHEYNYSEDSDYSTLELIMTAPMVVAHWINMQYYASTVDNEKLGAGNKLLHNVVGGRIGVFEGNGGDLRIGLSKQALHDGDKWMHTPIRLNVFIEAPNQAIESIISKHQLVQDLVNNEWIHLFSICQEKVYKFNDGRFIEQ